MNTPALTLRPTTEDDLPVLFAFQADETAAQMAAFMAQDWQNKEVYISKHKDFLRNPETRSSTILFNNEIAGSIGTYMLFGEMQVTYWIGRAYWNKGLATEALNTFIKQIPERPLYGRITFDNTGSARVLEKCGFKQVGVDQYHSNIRGKEIDELIFKLD